MTRRFSLSSFQAMSFQITFFLDYLHTYACIYKLLMCLNLCPTELTVLSLNEKHSATACLLETLTLRRKVRQTHLLLVDEYFARITDFYLVPI